MLLVIFLFPHADHGAGSGQHLLLRIGHIDAECLLLHRGGAAHAPFDPAFGQQIDRRHFFGDPRSVDVFVRHQRHAEAKPDVLGDLAERTQHHVVARHVAAPFAEMVLDQPRGVEALFVGQNYLFHAVLVGRSFSSALTPGVFPRPRLGSFEFI